MIKLEVCEYCHQCPGFHPEVVSRPEIEVLKLETFYDLDIKEDKIVNTRGDTVVKCKERAKCAAMYIYLKGENKNAEN